MKRLGYFVFLLLAFPLLASCGGPGSESEPSIEPEIRVFNVSPDVADAQATVVMSWDTDAESVEIEGIGMVPPSGSREMTADTSKVFTIIARVRDIVRTAQARLTVRPGPGNDPPVGPDPIPTPIPDPGPVPSPSPPPPQDACVENSGMQVALNTNLHNAAGGNALVVSGDTSYALYAESTLDDSFSRLLVRVENMEGVFIKELSSHFHTPVGGGIPSLHAAGSDGTIYVIHWRQNATDGQPDGTFLRKSFDKGKTWTPDVSIPTRGIIPVFSATLVVSGSNLYLFDQPNFDRSRILVNRSADGGNTWDPVKTVYENLNASVGLENAFVDSTGKVYVVFGESINNTSPREMYTELMVSTDNGATWSAPVKQQIFNEAQPEVGASLIDINGVIYQWYRDLEGWTIRSSTDFSSWTLVGRPPIMGNTLVGPYGFIVAQSALCGNNLVGLRVTRSSDGLVWSPPSWFQVLSIPNTDLGPNGGFVFPSFSLAATPSGKLITLRTRIMKNVDVNDPSEVYLMRDP